MISTALEQLLSRHSVPMRLHYHHYAATAADAASASHVPEEAVANVVVLAVDDRYVLAAVSANREIDLESIRMATGGREVRRVDERDCEGLFCTCEPGATAPFSDEFDVPLWVDTRLLAGERIFIRDGSHTELLELTPAEFMELFQPHVGPISSPRIGQTLRQAR